MARGGGRSRGAGAGKGSRKGAFNARSTKPTSTFFKQPAKATTKKKIPAVPMDDTWHQAVRRVYPGEGSCAFIRKAGLANDLEVLSPAHFGPQLSHMSCEAANRLANYLSMLSASVEEGAHLLQMQRDEADKVGLAQVSACFDGDEGANLVHRAVHSDSRLWPQTLTQTPQTPDSGPKL